MSLCLFVLTLVLAAGAAVPVLIAIWAGESKAFWFWRAFAPILCIAVLLPIRAYEPALVLSASLPIIALAVWVAGMLNERRIRFGGLPPRPQLSYRFTLRASLLAIAIFGMSLSLAVEIPRGMAEQPAWIRTEYPLDIGLPAAAVALVGLLAWYAVRGRFRIAALIGLAVAITCFAWFMSSGCQWLYVWDDDITEFGINSLLPSSDRERLRLIVTMLGLWEFATLVSVIALLSTAAARSETARHIRRAVLLATGFGLAMVYLAALKLPAFPPSVAVSPNHFDRIVQIAQRLKAINESSIAAEDVEEDNPAAATELRELCDELLPLLAVPNARSVDLSSKQEQQARERIDSDLFGLARGLSRWLTAEAKAARIRGDLPTAADFAIANIQFAAAFRTNGLLIDDMMARAMLNTSYREIYAARGDFDPSTARRVITVLHDLDFATEPMRRIIERDFAYCDRVYGWQGRFGHPIARVIQGNDPLRWKDYSQYPKAANIYRTLLRLLEIDLAIRAFQSTHAHLPDNLNELVPQFLPAVSLDPFTNRSFVYQAMPSGDFTLYGAGSDGINDDGTFTDLTAHFDFFAPHDDRGGGYDTDLETLVRPNPLLAPPP